MKTKAMILCAAAFAAFHLGAAPEMMSHAAATNFAAQVKYLAKLKEARTPVERKVDSELLLSIQASKDERMRSAMPNAMRNALSERFTGETVDCEIDADVSDALLARIVSAGGVVKSHSERFKSIHAVLPTDAVLSLAGDAAVRSIRPVVQPVFNKANTSEGVKAHKVDVLRNAYGITGAGIKVGVMSDSVRYLEDVQASGDLPDITVLEGQDGLKYSNGGSGEGTAMLEIVHDMAPGASLYFATAHNTMAEFAENILALANAGCKVIVDDVTYIFDAPFQDWTVSKAVNEATDMGCVYFSSAGNSGNLDLGESGTWEGDFTAFSGATSLGSIDFSDSGYDAMHDFGTADGCNGLLSVENRICLFWSDPYNASSNDYDLFLYDRDTGTIISSSIGTQDGSGYAREYVNPPNLSSYPNAAIAVLRKKGAESRYLRIDTNRGRLEAGTAGSTTAHHACEKGICVAAADAPYNPERAFTAEDPVEDFSSDGPRRIFYTPEGAPITTNNYLSTGGKLLAKVDFTAADGTSCATSGFRWFYGTSAAAPHAAAIAALVLQVNPDLTRDEVFEIMKETALSTNGWNRTTGWGILDANACVSKAIELYMTNPVTVVFNPNGGEIASESFSNRVVEAGSTLGDLPVANREYYSFAGWYTAASGGTKITAATVATKATTYYAHWTELATCWIAFDANGGTVATNGLRAVVGEAVGTLPVPSYPKHRFLGWYTAADGGALFDEESLASGNITLYAHWEEMPFVTGGDADWTVVSNGVWQSGNSGHSSTNWIEVTVTAPCTVSFDWMTSSEARYDKLHFYVDGVEVVTAISGIMTVWTNVTYAVTDSAGERTLRWAYTKDASYSYGSDCGWVRDFTVSALTMVTLTLDPAGGTVSSNQLQVVSGAAVGTLPTPVRSGYTFNGWWTTEDDSGSQVTAATTFDADATLYAHWMETTYSWTYTTDSNGNATISGSWSSAGVRRSDGGTLSGILEVPGTIDGHTVVGIGSYAFYNCRYLTEVILPNTVTNIGNCAFEDCYALEEIEIPSSVTSLGNYAFYYCMSLGEIEIPSSVKSIGYYAFYCCTSLRSVTLNEGLTSIGNYVFGRCTSLEEMEIPSSVKSIGYDAFYCCTSLRSVTLNEGLTSIGSYAFGFCSSLEEIEIPSSTTSISSGAFYGCSSLAAITVADGNAAYASRDGILYNAAFTTLVACGNGKEGDVEIPQTVTDIAAYAFYRNNSITSLALPDGLAGIGNYAFYGSGIFEELSPPETLESIGYYAFAYCDGLKDVEIVSEPALGGHAFYGCTNLVLATLSRALEGQVLTDDTIFGNAADDFEIVYVDPEGTVYHTVTFDPCGGTMDEEESRTVVSYVGVLPTPVYEGLMFGGWYTAASGGEKVTATTTVDGDIVLYAQWIVCPFTFGGSADWTYEGDGVWQSGAISDSQTTWMQAEVSGPCAVSFDWKVSSESWDRLYFYVDGKSAVSPISGTSSTSWTSIATNFTDSATHTLRWTYSKDISISYGSDCGWVRNFTVVPNPFSDDFDDALAIGGLSGVAQGDNSSATAEIGEPLYKHGCTVWCKWKAPSSGTATFNTNDSGFDTYMGVYTGDAVGSLAKVAEDDDSGEGSCSAVSFLTTAGTTYAICVCGYTSSNSGSITLNWSFVPSDGVAVYAGDYATVSSATNGASYIVTAEGGATLSAGNIIVYAGLDGATVDVTTGFDIVVSSDGTSATVTLKSPVMGVSSDEGQEPELDDDDPAGVLVSVNDVGEDNVSAKPDIGTGEELGAMPVQAVRGLYYQAAWGGDLQSMTQGEKVQATGDTLYLGVIKQTDTSGFYRLSVSDK